MIWIFQTECSGLTFTLFKVRKLVLLGDDYKFAHRKQTCFSYIPDMRSKTITTGCPSKVFGICTNVFTRKLQRSEFRPQDLQEVLRTAHTVTKTIGSRDIQSGAKRQVVRNHWQYIQRYFQIAKFWKEALILFQADQWKDEFWSLFQLSNSIFSLRRLPPSWEMRFIQSAFNSSETQIERATYSDQVKILKFVYFSWGTLIQGHLEQFNLQKIDISNFFAKTNSLGASTNVTGGPCYRLTGIRPSLFRQSTWCKYLHSFVF